jgi:uncharacterized protein DUF1552
VTPPSRSNGARCARRDVLRLGVYGLAVGPFLHCLLKPAWAAASPDAPAGSPQARRFIGVYTPHGVARELWVPGPGFDVSYEHCSLQPFDDPASFGQSFRERIVVVEGVDLAAGIEAGTVGHEGARVILTGSGADGDNASIDQFLAVEHGLGSSTPHSCLTLGVGVARMDLGANISYLPGGRPVPKRIDPSELYDALFGELILPHDGDAGEKLRARRAREQSSLDLLGEQLRSISARLPRAEASKLDQHLTAQRELERRLSHFEAACAVPARPAAFPSVREGSGAARYFDAITDLQIDLLVHALACDLTRFSTLFLNDLSRTRLLPGMPDDIHFDVSHRYRARGEGQAGQPESWLPLARQNRYAYSKVARLMQRLAERQLLDETLIYASSDMGDPSRHSGRGVPTLLAGGGLRGGRHLQVHGQAAANNHVLVSICHAFGVPVPAFGRARDAAINTGAMPELLARAECPRVAKPGSGPARPSGDAKHRSAVSVEYERVVRSARDRLSR